jgi:pfkB family carbohydrate kinase
MRHLKEQLISHRARLSYQAATLGFDGFIDSIVTLGNLRQPADHCNSMEAFGHYILSKKGSNFSLEIQQRSIKAGGNMPNMAGALAKLGVAVNCIGTLGYPVMDPVFSQSLSACRCYSFATPGTCQAIEFNDGKMMLAGMGELDKAGWDLLTQRILLTTLVKIFDNSRLTGLLNWGELTATTSIWKGLLQDVLPFCSTGKQRLFLVDLSDCSSRSKEEIFTALDLLRDFSRYGELTLSLNKNECRIIYQHLFGTVEASDDIRLMGEKIFQQLQPTTLILHQRETTMAFRTNEFVEKNSQLVTQPAVLTGAGDHFNAGFCAGQLMDLSLEESVTLAQLLAGCYIRKGESPGWEVLLEAIETL